MNLRSLRDALDKHAAEYALSCRQIVLEKENRDRVHAGLGDASAALGIVQEVAKTVQENAHRQIAAVVSRCLEAVFGEAAYEFKIAFEKKRNKTEARLIFARGGEEFDPVDSSGGGVIDVAAFALRVAALILSRPPKRRLLVLDEPFRFLSRDYLPAARELLEVLSEETGIQFLVVTHSDLLKTGKVVELG